MPHSSASHQSSAVLEEVTSTIGSTDINTPDPFDEISPITISQGEFRDDHGLLARRVEQINCRSDAARPLHNQSVRFDVLQDRGFRAPVGHKNYCSCSFVGLHRFSNAA